MGLAVPAYWLGGEASGKKAEAPLDVGPSGVVSTTETNLRAMPRSFSSSAAAQAAMVVLRR